jgi:hypothetical protein
LEKENTKEDLTSCFPKIERKGDERKGERSSS